MAWRRHLIETAELQLGPRPRLDQVLRSLYAKQVGQWPRLADAVAALGTICSRELTVDGRRVVVQWNPRRRASTMAQVDAESLRERACFLCAHNLPPEQKGVAFGRDMVLLVNPAPILPLHFTIVHRRHVRQAFLPVLRSSLALVQAVGGGLTVLYNGPRCGASAPDHLHLQAVAAGEVPEEKELVSSLNERRTATRGRPLMQRADLCVWCDRASFRVRFGFAGSTAAVGSGVRAAVEALAEVLGTTEEPPMNLLIHARGEKVAVLLYARGAHRPACYYASGAEQCLVSPGAIDMAGLVVTVRREDFERIDAERLASIYAETSLDSVQVRRVEQLLVDRLREGTCASRC